MWMKFGVLTFAAVVVPSFIPTQYIPFDPTVCPCLFARYLLPTLTSCIIQNPATDVNPEQTASWFSFVFFFFVDDIIFKASRVPHLPAEEFPPLADYDWAPHIVRKSFPVRSPTPRMYATSHLDFNRSQHLDPLSGTTKKNIFFGLLKIFRREYVAMSFLLVSKVGILLAEVLGNRPDIHSPGSDQSAQPDRDQWLAHLFG